MRRVAVLAGLLAWALPLLPWFAVAAGDDAAGPPADARREGARTVRHLCMLCHSLKYVRYRDLLDLGLERAEVDALRGGQDLNDRMLSTMGREAAVALFGVVPPDLSVMAAARNGGTDYLYRLLTGYFIDERGRIDNRVFPGIAMPDPFAYAVAPDAGERARIERRVRATVAFLAWSADPRADERRRIGYGVMAYLFVLTLLLYLVKRRIWARLDEPA